MQDFTLEELQILEFGVERSLNIVNVAQKNTEDASEIVEYEIAKGVCTSILKKISGYKWDALAKETGME